MKKITRFVIEALLGSSLFALMGCSRLGGASTCCSDWLGSQETLPMSSDGRSRAQRNYRISLSVHDGSKVKIMGAANDVYTVTNGCFVAFRPCESKLNGIWPALAGRSYIVARISPLAGKDIYGLIQVKVKITAGYLKGCIVTIKPGELFGDGPESTFGFVQDMSEPIEAIYLIPAGIEIPSGALPFRLVSFTYK